MLASRSRLLSLTNAHCKRRFFGQSCPKIDASRYTVPRTRNFHSSPSQAPGTGITIHFRDAKGSLVKTVEANEGDDLLSIAHEHDVDLEGACEGSVACSTCHVILPPEYYDLLPEPDDDENDMLDMAFALTDTSRLGCQVKLTRELDGMTAMLPAATRNMFVDGKKSSH
ncbi:ferredoxin [Mycena filopes]|nr:ferredoxin [Mycena filopes]